MTPRLFVYGTLAPGRSNAYVLASLAGTWERGSVLGTLHAEGWGAAAGYPGIVLDPGGTEVDGFLFTSPDLAAHWERLDAFEGPGYDRALTTVRRTSAGEVEAYIYVLSRAGLPPRAD